MEENKPQNQIQIKVTDEILQGRYSNLVEIMHTKEEFALNFMSVVGPAGAIVSRIFMSPGHIKRMIKALQQNLDIHEKKFGAVIEASDLGSGIIK